MEKSLLITTLVCAALMSCEEQGSVAPYAADRPAEISVLPGFPAG